MNDICHVVIGLGNHWRILVYHRVEYRKRGFEITLTPVQQLLSQRQIRQIHEKYTSFWLSEMKF